MADLGSRVDPTLGPYRGKRFVDLAVVVAVALPAGLVSVVAAALIKVTSPGPVLFRQQRVGYRGEIFEVLKFRTMVDRDHAAQVGDDVITPVGRILRRFALDELPQLINIWRGDMSIVGPRPTLAYQAAQWNDQQVQRLAVRPGLTGLAQVSGRNDLSWPERIAFDVRYVDQQSWRFDLTIVARTVGVLLSGSGSGLTAADDPLASAPEPTLGEPDPGSESHETDERD